MEKLTFWVLHNSKSSILQDPTGTIGAAVHQTVFNTHPNLEVSMVLLLKKVRNGRHKLALKLSNISFRCLTQLSHLSWLFADCSHQPLGMTPLTYCYASSLPQVSVFSPLPDTGYLCILPDNIAKVRASPLTRL